MYSFPFQKCNIFKKAVYCSTSRKNGIPKFCSLDLTGSSGFRPVNLRVTCLFKSQQRPQNSESKSVNSQKQPRLEKYALDRQTDRHIRSADCFQRDLCLC